jgi:hypothetical protein
MKNAEEKWNDAERAWSEKDAAVFANQMRRGLGNAWNFFTPAVQKAMVAQEAFSYVRSSPIPVSRRAMTLLMVDMERALGLREEDMTLKEMKAQAREMLEVTKSLESALSAAVDARSKAAVEEALSDAEDRAGEIVAQLNFLMQETLR